MPQPISHKAWFITGASKGFGYVWTEAAVARGDSVAAAARNIRSLDRLKVKYGDRPLTLVVGNKGVVDAAFAQAHKQLGHIDVASITPATACSEPSKRSRQSFRRHLT